jgi:hypothetical protein
MKKAKIRLKRKTKILLVAVPVVIVIVFIFFIPIIPVNGNRSFVAVRIGDLLGPTGTLANSNVTITVTQSKLLTNDITLFNSIGENVGTIPKDTVIEPNGTFLLSNGTFVSPNSLPSQYVSDCTFHSYSSSDWSRALDSWYGSISTNNMITVYCSILAVDDLYATNYQFNTAPVTVNFYKPVAYFDFTFRPNVITNGYTNTWEELRQLGQIEEGTITVGDTGLITVYGYSSYFHSSDRSQCDASATFSSQPITYTGSYFLSNNGNYILGANPTITYMNWQDYFQGFNSYKQTSEIFSGDSHTFNFDFPIKDTDVITITTDPQVSYTYSRTIEINYKTIYTWIFGG